MASFTSGRTDFTPHGKRNILRHAHPGSYDVQSRTISGGPTGSWPVETIDGFEQKVLQEGEAIARITSGPNVGKYGAFQAGVTDGRQDVANLVGIVKDYFGVQLIDRDVEAGVLVRGHLVQAWCTERNAAGARVPLSNTTADALRGKKNLQIQFS
jgi:hypothetical protein